MRFAALALLAIFAAIPARGESDPVVRVDFSNPGLYPAQWSLVLHPDGHGHFHAEGGTKSKDSEDMEPGKIDRDVTLGSDFTKNIFQTMHDKRILKGDCDSHLKVAFQGTKKISYSGPDAEGGCEFNYSTHKEIQALGESLELLLQHDPLGLDKAIQYVVEATKDGRLQQICAIRGILERLQDDPHVMDRVRKRARMLLATSGS
jgi:hypothetical protein